MKFKEKNYLEQRDSTSQLSPEEISGKSLLVGTCIATWNEGHTEYGFDDVEIFPAYHDGEKAFLISRDWNASAPYCAEGTEEEIISFKEGVNLLLSKGAYEHLFKEEENDD